MHCPGKAALKLNIMAIQVLQPRYEVEECLAEIRECLEIGWTGSGFKTLKFEEDWKEYTGLPYAHFLNSATAGLHLAVKMFKEVYGWAEGDEVITTPLTFVSTNHGILHEGLQPVFADVDDRLCLDPRDVLNKITPRTRALMFVGLGGNVGQYHEIEKICKEKGIKLILDAAHMAGTRVGKEIVGTGADVVVYSFQAVKNLASSHAGMICFKEDWLDEMCRKYSWQGINKDTYSRSNMKEGSYKWQYDVEYTGFKYHGNSIAAAIAIVQLRYLDRDNAYRRQLADWYDAALADTQGLRLIDHKGCTSSRHLYQIEVDRRDELYEYLNEHDIYPGVHYRDNTEYKMYAYAHGTCPNAHRLTKRILTLPLHLRMTHEDVLIVAAKVRAFVGKLVTHNQD